MTSVLSSSAAAVAVTSKKEVLMSTELSSLIMTTSSSALTSSSSSSPVISASSSVSSASMPLHSDPSCPVNLDDILKLNKLNQIDNDLDEQEEEEEEEEEDEEEENNKIVSQRSHHQQKHKHKQYSVIKSADSTSVRVAVRIRPQSIKERVEMCKICTHVTPHEPQIRLGNKDDKSFTFDAVYNIDSKQEDIFESSVRFLVDGCLDGYNATVLAYGQTGSGKTYTMGTSFDTCLSMQEEGILPRAISYLFEKVEQKFAAIPNSEIIINAQFIELYNEEIIDLLESLSTGSAAHRQISQFNNNNNNGDLIHEFNSIKTKIEIHEDQFGGIFINGCSTINVQSIQETLNILKHGAKIRSTGATNMNLQSSRSHAIFTLNIKQKCLLNSSCEDDSTSENTEHQTLTAKFHFVDLAGSERLKRTGATGSRAKEGICINRGLLALGNVISALGDREKIGCHVPYRDSKLTRLLQDSLGGNSRTLMIACVSPSDRDFMETLNTLRYANRTRNIKNKVFVNQDKTSLQIAQLKAEIERLNYELIQFKSKTNNNSNSTTTNTSNNNNNNNNISRTASSATIVNTSCSVNDSTLSNGNNNESPVEFLFMVNKLRQENIMLLTDNQNLRQRTRALQETLEKTKLRNCDLEFTNQKLISQLNNNLDSDQHTSNPEQKIFNSCSSSLEAKLKDYIRQIEELKCKLAESEIECKLIRQQSNQIQSNTIDPILLNCSTESLNQVKHTEQEEEEEEEGSFTKKEDDTYDLQMQSMRALGTSQLSINPTEIEFDLIDCAKVPEVADTENQHKLQAEINTLGFEIDLKKRLIGELETNNKNLEKMKSYYEDKLHLLYSRIKQIENERDKIIGQLTAEAPSSNDEQIKKIRLDYEFKLQSLQADLHKYQQIKAKNSEMLRQAQENERNLQQLNRELLEMKKLKVKLMNQLKDESIRFKKEEQNRMREIATLKRDHLKKDSQIKFLEAEKKCKEVVLKRKQEQLQALRRNNTTRLSDKASGKFFQNSFNNLTPSVIATNGRDNRTNVNGSSSSSSNGACSLTKNSTDMMTSIFKKKGLFSRSFQLKWQKLDQIINGIIVKKQTISLIERDMERFLEQREKISRKLNRLVTRLDRKMQYANQDGLSSNIGDESLRIDELKDRIDVMKSNIDYLQDQIGECQTNIIHLDELKDGNDYLNLENFIETITSVNEAKYFLKKLLVLGLNKGIVAAQKEFLCNELKCELEQYERDYNTQQQLLQNIINNSNTKAANSKTSNQKEDEETSLLNKQFMNSFNNYFNNQLNGGVHENGINSSNNKNNPDEPNEYNSDNFEIDEIILAPQFEDSTTESEDEEDVFIKKFRHTQQQQQQNELQDSDALLNDSSVKARQQLIMNGPRDLLYCSKTNLDKTFSNSKVNLSTKTQSAVVNNKSAFEFNNQLSSLANQVSRICSKSYTKIPEIVNNQIDLTNYTIAGTVNTQCQMPNNHITTNTSIQIKSSQNNLNNISMPMSKSVIVTSSDNTNYKRMTRSSMSRQNSKDSFLSTSPSRSPVNYSSSRRLTSKNSEQNVFNRLTSETKQSPMPERGIIKIYSGNTNRFRSYPVTLTHVAEGHSKAILSIDSNDFKLYTGSKDRTAKIWDIITGQEIAALNDHNNNVIKIRYCRNTQLCFTATSSYVKVWDLRESSTKCIKNLSPSGLVYDGNTPFSVMNKTKILQNDNQNLDQNINDLAIDEFGNYLYIAAGNSIKIWDLKQFSEIAKLSGGHNSSIMTMLIKDNELITGSKDHYIRVFELSSSFNLFQTYQSSTHSNNSSDFTSTNSSSDVNNLLNGVQVSKYNMMPPHYDGVQTLCRFDDHLFSGSRDMCIKKWSMTDHQCRQSINNAHKDWICSLDFFSEYNNNSLLLSGCRGGYLKMWNSETLEKIADFRAHLCPINSIKVNNHMLFTASDDATVRIWRKDK